MKPTNPDELLKGILALCDSIKRQRSAQQAGHELAERVHEMHEHLTTGGRPPEAWTAEGTAVGTALEAAVDGLGELAQEIRTLKASKT